MEAQVIIGIDILGTTARGDLNSKYCVFLSRSVGLLPCRCLSHSRFIRTLIYRTVAVVNVDGMYSWNVVLISHQKHASGNRSVLQVTP